MNNFFFLNCNSVKFSDQHTLIKFYQSFSAKKKETNEFIEIFETKIIKQKISLNTIQHLLSTIRKYCDYLRNISLITNEFIPSKKQYKIDWLFLRQEIIDCLMLLDDILDNEKISIDLKKLILLELKNLLLSINRISNLPEHVFYELYTISSNKNGCNNQLFHFYLETWLNIYQLFKRIDSSLKEEICLVRDNNYNGDLLNQFKFILLSDLVLISLNKFNVNRLDFNYRSSDPYICDCLKLLYLELFSDYEKSLSENLLQHPFWLDFNKILDYLKTNNLNNELENESIRHFPSYILSKNHLNENTILSHLWLIFNLAQLFDYYFKENNFEKISKENSEYVNSLVKSFIKKEENEVSSNDALLLNILKISIKLSKIWTLNNETVLIFLDFFMKRLNNPIQAKNLKNLQIIPKSSYNWYEKLLSISLCDENMIETEENFTQIFFFLLFNFVKKSIDDISINNNFQKIKGRLYSRLQIKKIEELKEAGLYNLLNTFLIILFVSKNNKSDLITKYHFILKAVKSKSANLNKLPLVLRSLFCISYFLVDNEAIMKSISLINEIFNEVADSMPIWTSNNIQISSIHNSYYEVINIYFLELNAFFKNCKSINSSFSNLLDCKFNVLFTKLSEREICCLIHFLKNLIQLVKFNLEENDNTTDLNFYNNLHQKMKKNFSEFLKTQIQSKSYDPEFSIVTSEFLHLVCLLSNHEETFKNLLDSFLFSKYFDMLNLCDLLNYIVDNQTIFYKIIDVNTSTNLELKFLDLWLEIAISILLPNKQFNQLTKKLSMQFQLLNTSNEDLKSIEDVFKNLTFYYKNLTMTNQMKFINDINHYLVETINLGKKLIKEELSEEILTQFYSIISSFIEYCTEIIYISGNCNSILPQILEYFYNSNYIQSFSSNKSQMINKCIKKTFSKVFIGLSNLHERNDPYIDRKLRFMFITYVPMFLCKNVTHPLMIEMNQNEETSKKLFGLIFFYVKDCIFIKCNQNPTVTIQLIQFTQELFIFFKNKKEQREKLFSVFPLVLQKILSSEEITKRKLRDFLNLMYNEIKVHSEFNVLNHLTNYYEEFIAKNSDNLIKVIRSLDFIISVCLPVKEKIVSFLMVNIKKIEDSPSGVDDHLRNTFRQFVNKIEN